MPPHAKSGVKIGVVGCSIRYPTFFRPKLPDPAGGQKMQTETQNPDAQAPPAQPRHAKKHNKAIIKQQPKPQEQPADSTSVIATAIGGIGAVLVILLAGWLFVKWAKWWVGCLRAAAGYRKIEVIHKYPKCDPRNVEEQLDQPGYLSGRRM